MTKRVFLYGFMLLVAIMGFCGFVMSNDVVYADGETYTVSFDSDGGAIVNNISVTNGSEYTLSSSTRTGYDFLGWYYGSQKVELSGTWNIVPESGNEIQLTAHWELVSYSIMYRGVEGLENNNPSSYNVTSNIVFNSVAKPGYNFVGWREGTLTLVEKIEPNTRVGALTLEADWEPIDYTITYVNILSGMTNTNPTTYTIEDEINLEAVNKIGYTFVGWYTDLNNEDSKITQIKDRYGDISLYAKWTINQYTIKFDYGNLDNIIAEYATTINDIPIPTKEGYTFEGWYTDTNYRYLFTSNTEISSDLTLHAKWQKIIDPVWYIVMGSLAFVTILIGLIWYMINRKKINHIVD